MKLIKKAILFTLIFNMTYAPGPGVLDLLRVNQSFASEADGGSTDSSSANGGKQESTAASTSSMEWQTLTPSDLSEAEKGSQIEVVLEENKSNSSDNANAGPRVTITPGTDPNYVYNEGRPSAIRSKIGTLWHYLALRNSDVNFSDYATKQEARDRRDPVTAKDIKDGSIHFFNENLSFNIALAAVKIIHLVKNYGSSPVVLQDFIESSKDPIGYISFYSFMVANGYTVDFLQDIALRKTASGKLMQKTFTSIIPYLAMTAGSMASNITGDMLRLFQACAGSISERGRGTIKNLHPSQDPCELAWHEWTIEKKFHTYGPSLISMLTATWASGLVSSILKKAYDKTLNKAEEIFSSFPEKSLTRQSIIKLKFVGSRFAPFAIKSRAARYSLMIMGKVPNFMLFLGLSELFEPTMTFHFENLTRGGHIRYLPGMDTINTLASKFMRIIYEEKKNNWSGNGTAQKSCYKDNNKTAFMGLFPLLGFLAKQKFIDLPIEQDLCAHDGDIKTWLTEFSAFMKTWRDFNQADVIKSHQAWVSKINNLKNTERLAYYFNEYFVNDLRSIWIADQAKLEISKIKDNYYKLNKKQISDLDIDSSLFRKARYQSYVLRDYPLFGVKTKISADKLAGQYLNSPDNIEIAQLETIKEMVMKFEAAITWDNLLLAQDKVYLSKILNNLKSNDKFKIGMELKEIKSRVDEFHFKNIFTPLSNEGIKFLDAFYKSLGSPRPQFATGAGYTNIFNDYANSIMIDGVNNYSASDYLENSRLDETFGPYRSTLKMDHLVYQMLCGFDTYYLNNEMVKQSGFVKEWFGFSDEFIPPRLIKSSISPDLCDFSPLMRASGKMYTDNIRDKNSGRNFNGIFNFIIPNLRTEIKELTASQIKVGNPDIAFWWNEIVAPVMVRQFQKYHEQYEEIAVDLVKTFYAADPITNRSIIKNSVAYSSMQEIRIYSLILAEILRDQIRTQQIKGDIPELKYINPDLIGNVDDSEKKDKLKLKNWKPITSNRDEDIFKYQFLPYNGELFLMLDKYQANNRKPNLFEFQYQIELLIARFHQILSKIEIEKRYNKNYAIIKYSQAELAAFDKQRADVDKIFKAISVHLGAPDDTDKEKNKNKDNSQQQQVVLTGEQQRILEIVEFIKNKIMGISGQVDGIAAQLNIMKYNKDSAPLKEECRTEKTTSGSVKVGNCK